MKKVCFKKIKNVGPKLGRLEKNQFTDVLFELVDNNNNKSSNDLRISIGRHKRCAITANNYYY